MKSVRVYGLYKGDVFIDVGTADELAERLNIKKETVYFYASNTNKKRNKKGNKIEAVCFDEAI